jgi:hypothetical protein
MNTQPEQPAQKTNRLAMVSFICGSGITIPVACIVATINIAAGESAVMLFIIFTYRLSIRQRYKTTASFAQGGGFGLFVFAKKAVEV